MKQFVLFLVIVVGTLSAQQWQWPESPKNLTVLPSSAKGRELQRIMFGFNNSLGVRCVFCHVGEDGKDFKEFDFVSDAKPMKGMARMMIKMTKEINGKYFEGMQDETGAPIQVNCQTCHRGNYAPITLEDKLKRTFDAAGIDSTIRLYRSLREQFYGGFTYNFKEGTLLRLADKIAEDSTNMSSAIAVVKLNIEMYPSFAFSYTHLASWYEDMGNTQGAIDNYRKAIELTPGPRAEQMKKRLEKLQNAK
jgi:hypothetical protein